MSEYDAAGTISEKEAEELLGIVREFKIKVESWLKKNRPEFYPGE